MMNNTSSQAKEGNMPKAETTAQEALQTMCYTSERNWEGDVYTISDRRFPEYNGRKILVALSHGRPVFSWVDGKVAV
jgi:hypothetical protein